MAIKLFNVYKLMLPALMVLVEENLVDGNSRESIAVGSSRSGEKTMKEEKKTSSSSSLKSQPKGEEAMDWDADTKDVLQQLLRDDVPVRFTSVETILNTLL